MTGRPTSRVLGGSILAIVALFLAVATRRADAVALAAPFVLISLTGLIGARAPSVDAGLTVPTRLTEEETTEVILTLETTGGRGRARARLALPIGMTLVGDDHRALEFIIEPGTHRQTWTVRAERWGVLGPVRVGLEVTDTMGTRSDSRVLATEPVRVYPIQETLRRSLSPHSLRTIAGAHLSRQRGDGIEFMDIREFVRGDRARDVNWRVSARRERLWVDQRQPERSGEVVLFLDSFASVGTNIDSTLRRSAEVAAALARRHVALNDRVGLVDLGGVLRWLRPGGGTAQLYRLVEVLIETERYASAAAKTIDVLPSRALPKRCLVVALSPLVDERGLEAIRALRARGFDVAVIEMSPGPHLPASESDLARGLWELEREAIRSDLRRRGIAVATWDGEESVDHVLQSLGVFRSAVLRAAR
ncbi:MAG TPA: DUF58 domain-containing protein [Acidimicrobiia bacterium]